MTVKSMHPFLYDIVEIICAQPLDYRHPVSPHQLRGAAELAAGLVDNIVSSLSKEERDVQLARMKVYLQSTAKYTFTGKNPRRVWPGVTPFESHLARHNEPLRDNRSIHLELGTHDVWRGSRASDFIREERIGDMIRLDMNLEYGPDVGANACALPFANETIDRVYSDQLFEHVAFPQEIVSEAYRVLRPGGIFLTIVPYHFIQHDCPHDYLRIGDQFFKDVCGEVGFSKIYADIKSTSGLYFTAHQFIKSAEAVNTDFHPAGRGAITAHLVMIILSAMLQSFDTLFHAHAASFWTETRALAIKSGTHVPRKRDLGRDRPFLERFAEDLICPATGQPITRHGNQMISRDGTRTYPIIDEIPNLFVPHGFASSFGRRDSSSSAAAGS